MKRSIEMKIFFESCSYRKTGVCERSKGVKQIQALCLRSSFI